MTPHLRRRLLVLALVSAGLMSSCAESEDGASVRFIQPIDGSTVSSPVAVEMGVENFIVEPAANGVIEGHGHLHIMIDTTCVEARRTVPPDAQHLHFGKGQTETVLDLEPGTHFLCLQAADGDHGALAAIHEITITVE